MRLLLLRRLRLALLLKVRRCKCGSVVNTKNDHRTACPMMSKVVQRSLSLKKAWARVCREAGSRVVENRKLRKLNLKDFSGEDDRKLEVVADNLSL